MLLIAALGRCVRLLRFLKGYKWNVEEAAAVVRASIKWREEYGVRTLPSGTPDPLETALRIGLHAKATRARNNHLCAW
jgi:hypothetical protein